MRNRRENWREKQRMNRQSNKPQREINQFNWKFIALKSVGLQQLLNFQVAIEKMNDQRRRLFERCSSSSVRNKCGIQDRKIAARVRQREKGDWLVRGAG